MLVAERLRQRLERLPVYWKGVLVPLTASFGVATLDGKGTADDLLGSADAALYRAKTAGRNRVVCAATQAGTTS